VHGILGHYQSSGEPHESDRKRLPLHPALRDCVRLDGHAAQDGGGWSKYEEVARFEGSTREQVFNAAKAGLGSADFALVSANLGLGVVIGQHGMTAHDWNIVAGVYFRERDAGYDVKVIAEGSKDFGFSGDATSGAWTGRILNGMRSILKQSGATATSTTGSK
jgi:hypothetical protein